MEDLEKENNVIQVYLIMDEWILVFCRRAAYAFLVACSLFGSHLQSAHRECLCASSQGSVEMLHCQEGCLRDTNFVCVTAGDFVCYGHVFSACQ